jgi:hypothetical protein
MKQFDRKVFFDSVRASLFSGSLTQQQVDGMERILDQWEATGYSEDLRWLAYPLATTYHETAQAMWPIEEYGKGEGHDYGAPDPETGQCYYGRGYVQLTWRDNYARASDELDLRGGDNLEWHAAGALDPIIAADVMFVGMIDGWFRSDGYGPQTLARYFGKAVDDPYGAREIINGDKDVVPSWSATSIGNLIKDYHEKFMDALDDAWIGDVTPPAPDKVVAITIEASPGVTVTVNGRPLA